MAITTRLDRNEIRTLFGRPTIRAFDPERRRFASFTQRRGFHLVLDVRSWLEGDAIQCELEIADEPQRPRRESLPPTERPDIETRARYQAERRELRDALRRHTDRIRRVAGFYSGRGPICAIELESIDDGPAVEALLEGAPVDRIEGAFVYGVRFPQVDVPDLTRWLNEKAV